jgi:hypothetical protein
MNALGAVFTGAACWALGTLLFRGLRISLRRFEHDLLAGMTGAALLSLIGFLLCSLRMARTPVFLLLGMAALGGGIRVAVNSPRRESLPSIPAFWKWLFAIGFVLYSLLYLSNSLAPEHSPDGSTYHLGLVARYFRDGGFVLLTTNFYGSLSQGMEMLFLFAFAFGRHPAAATVHCLFLLTLPYLLLSYGRRIGHPRAGVTAAMLVFLSPLVGIDGVSAYNDVALATVAFSMFYALEIWREGREDRLLIPIGLLAGFCFAIKYTGFVAPLYAILILLIQGGWFKALITGASSALMAAPWLLKNWIWLGNPVSPFLNRWFPNPWIHISFENFYRTYLRSYGLTSFAPLFRIVTVTGELGGQLGPVFLLAPMALFALRFKHGRYCLLAALFFLIPYPQNIGARFLIPALPFVAFGIALGFEFSRALQAALVVAALVLAWPRVIDRYRAPAGGWQIETMPWQVTLHLRDPEAWLLDHSSGYGLALTINQTVPPNKRIWSTMPVSEAYTKPDVLVYYYSAECETIHDTILTALQPPLRTLRFTFPPRTLGTVRFVNREASPEIWNVADARFYSGGTEIPVARVASRPFPWEAGLAFDHNPATRWRSWEPMRSGMYLEADFGKPQQIDRAELQADGDLALAGIPAKVGRLDLPAPPEVRRLATQAIKARGIDYLLMGGEHPASADMRKDPEAWGLRIAAERGPDRIYQIQ